MLGAHTAVMASGDPDIQVSRTDVSADIPDGGSFAMGATTVGEPFTQYISVGNATGLLTIAAIDVPAGFSMPVAPPSTIEGGASHGLHLQCNAAALGEHSGQLVIHSDDPDESLYEINVSCSVAAAGTPTIRMVTSTGVAVADGGSLTLAPGTGVLLRVYNDEGSTGPLNLLPPTVAPAGPTLGNYIPDDVVSVNGASTYFNVRCATALSSAGVPVSGTFAVSVGNNVPGSENPYTFTLDCTDGDPPATDPSATDPSGTKPVDSAPAETMPGGNSGAGSATSSVVRALPTTGRSGASAAMAGALLLSLGGLVLWLVRRPQRMGPSAT